jgi:hypothetical protein
MIVVFPGEAHMRVIRLLAVLVVSFCVTGCINSGTLIKVKPDGSGTIEQSILMNLASLKGLMAGLDPQGQMKENTPFSEAQLKQTADRLGKGVRFVSSTPVKEGGFEGVKAIYAFDDINQIRVDQDPNISGASDNRMSSAENSNPVTFTFARQGANSVLTVSFNEKATAGTASPDDTPIAPEAVDPAMMQMMKAMFQGFKVAIDLEVEGKIVKTNADYVNGSRITLLEIDMAGLLEDEAKLRALQSKVKPGASIAEVKPYLKDVKGVKINNPVVTVEYR